MPYDWTDAMVTVRILDRLEELGMSDAEFNQLHGWDKSFNQHRQHCLKLVTGRFQAGGGNARRQEKFYRALLDLAERRSETVDKSFIFRGTPDQPLVDAPEDHLSRALRGLGAEVNPDVLARARYAVAHYGRAQDFPEDSEERFTHLWKSFNALYSQARSTMATDATQRQLQSQLITRVVRRSPELVNRWGLACARQAIEAVFALESGARKYAAERALENNDLQSVLKILSEGVYELRNKVFHGSLVWSAEKNSGTFFLVNTAWDSVIEMCCMVLLENPAADWGRVSD